MRGALTATVARQIESLFEVGAVAGLSDRQLIERFLASRDHPDAEAAFAAIVARHGPMVLGVCRQLLGDAHHAEDAFQAVFLVLARRAHAVRDPEALGHWLYGVALRTSRKARGRLARAREAEQRRAAGLPESRASDPADRPAIDREQAEALHAEVERLPATSRAPVVLCYFEGLSLAEAAERLRCPAGTVHSRLVRAREKLRRGLIRRGVVLSGPAMAAALAPRSASAAVSSRLCESTARAAIHGAGLSGPAAAMAREVLHSMMIHKVGLVMMAVLLLGAGATAAVHLNQDATATAREAPGRASPTTDPARAAPGRMFVVGRVLDPQGRPVPGASVMAYAGIKQPGPDRRFEGRQPSPIGRAASDGSGRFRLDAERTSSARHQLVGAVATAPGLGAGWVELDPDLDRPASEIVLRPEQIIEGRLFDLVGRPVAGVRVEVHAMGRVVPARLGGLIEETTEGPDLPWSHGQDRPGWPAPATSDAEGRFTIRGLGRGVRVRLGIDDPRFARLATRIDTDDAPGPKSLKIALEPARTIVGRVTDAGTGRPIPRARILVLSRKGGGSGGYINEFRADDEGRFRLNPLPGDSYSVSVDPPPGRPNLSDDREFAWPKGSVEHRIDFALPRGEPIRGKVVEEGSGRGIGGAWVGFRGRRTVGSIGNTETAPDGSFQLAAKPTPGYLIVLGPSDEYVYREIGNRLLDDGQPGGRRFYAHAFVAHDVKPGTGSPEVTISLRRGGTVRGLVVGPDGRPIPSAAMIGRTILNSSFSPYRYWMYNHAGRVRDGRFEVHGLDPDAEVPVHFFEPKGQLGATAMLSGKSGNDGPVTVRLGPCGTARARLVDRDGRPVAGYRGARLIAIIVTPGAVQSRPGPPPEPLADSAGFAAIDPAHYGDDLVSDADGRIALPDLIPGASYRVIARDRDRRVTFQKDFTLKPGEAIDLGDIVVERP